MAFITLDHSHMVGVPSIDDEHRELAALINKLHVNLYISAPDTLLQASFLGLADHAAAHFRHEEELCASSRYPRTAEHARKHRELLDSLARFERALDRSGPLIELTHDIDFLWTWLVEHIIEEDIPLGAHLRSQGVG